MRHPIENKNNCFHVPKEHDARREINKSHTQNNLM